MLLQPTRAADKEQIFLGSTLRGALGQALAHTPDLRTALFDPQAQVHSGPSNPPGSLPTPYALLAPIPIHDPALITQAQQYRFHQSLELILFGPIQARADDIARMLAQSLKHLPTPLYRRTDLYQQAIDLRPEQAPPCPDHPITLHLLSPLQLQQQSRILPPDQFSFSVFFTTLLRRISNLQRHYGKTPLQADFTGLKQRSQSVLLLNTALQPFREARWSNRKRQSMPLKGLTGQFTLDLAPHPELWPLLWAGQFTQTGRLTSMGFGAYRIETASLPNPIHATESWDNTGHPLC